uniref:Anti-proliferative protein domain-containing protein n=1 Tax=Ficedula albicollis TaxID=59894 RepID=A0A803W2M7_FICAL
MGWGLAAPLSPWKRDLAPVSWVQNFLHTSVLFCDIPADGFSPSLPEHYRHHWFPEKPSKGSGYRCLRISHGMDPIISRAAGRTGLSLAQLFQLLPSELTLWVDPFEVSYRIGDDGSICVLYEAASASKTPKVAACKSSYGGMLTCKNQMMLGRASPSKNYIMTVSG